MRAYYMFMAASVLATMTLAPGSASAGTRAPLSSIAALPRAAPLEIPRDPATVPGLVVKTKEGYRGSLWNEVTAATSRGYCLAATDGGYRWLGVWGTSSKDNEEEMDLERLVEKDGTATLERTRVRFDPKDSTSLRATGRSSVVLQEVARTSAGIVVWAYRDGKNVVVLARNVDRGVEGVETSPDDASFPFTSSDGCPYAGARLDARKPEAGTTAQLTGALPAQGKGKDKVVPRFIVDVSLSRVARDPEPMLSVRVRVRD